MAEIDTNDIDVSVSPESQSYDRIWKRRLKAKIKAAQDGDVLIVRSGLQKATALAMLTWTDKKLNVVKR